MTNKEFLTESLFSDFLNFCDDETQIEFIKENPFNIILIENPSEQVQLEAVKISSLVIKNIKNPSEEAQLTAVKQESWLIKILKNPSEKVQLIAIEQMPRLIAYLENPTKSTQLLAVKLDPYMIQYIKKPDADVQIEAIKNLDNFVDKADVHIFVFHFLKYLNNSLALSLLYNKTTNSKVKNKIKSSKYWKDDANLILEVIDE